MNNSTIREIKIKLRGDGVYDIYVNNKWVSSRGSYLSVANEIKKLLTEEFTSRKPNTFSLNED